MIAAICRCYGISEAGLKDHSSDGMVDPEPEQGLFEDIDESPVKKENGRGRRGEKAAPSDKSGIVNNNSLSPRLPKPPQHAPALPSRISKVIHATRCHISFHSPSSKIYANKSPKSMRKVEYSNISRESVWGTRTSELLSSL